MFGILEDLGELGKEHDQKVLDFVLVAGGLIAEVGMEADKLAVGGRELVGHIRGPDVIAEEGARNRHCIEFVGFGCNPRRWAK